MTHSIQIPNILAETSEGQTSHAILDEMFAQREVECVGDITQESVHSLILQLRYLQKTDPQKEITMYINSPGGEVTSGLALYDVMKVITCPIRTVCVGLAASMGALLFISGNRREMLPHARVMIHDPSISEISGTALKIDNISKDLMRIRNITGAILADHTGRKLDEILQKTATDSYFDAEAAIAFGMADAITNSI